MAVELFSENCGVSMSPRISFSHDFSQSDVIPVERHPLRSNSSGLNSSIDFDFCVQESLELDQSSSADELFSDGIILPIEIKKKNNLPLKQTGQGQPPPLPTITTHANNASKKQIRAKEIKDLNNNNNDDVDEKQISNSKSFWRFKRSSSCGSGYGRSLCPLPLLSRSNSTGSTSPTSSVKKMPIYSKEGSNIKQNSSTTTRSSQIFGPNNNNNHQKPPLKKSHHRTNVGNNSIRVSPVLNVPPASNLFGLGSIFSNNKSKKK